MLSWPAELPQCAIFERERAVRDGRLVTAPDRGRPFLRGGSSAVPKPMPVVFPVSTTQLARFERFFEEETEGGSLPFLIRDQDFDNMPLLDEDGVPLLDEDDVVLRMTALWLAQFGPGAPVSRRVAATRYDLAFTLAVL